MWIFGKSRRIITLNSAAKREIGVFFTFEFGNDSLLFWFGFHYIVVFLLALSDRNGIIKNFVKDLPLEAKNYQFMLFLNKNKILVIFMMTMV